MFKNILCGLLSGLLVLFFQGSWAEINQLYTYPKYINNLIETQELILDNWDDLSVVPPARIKKFVKKLNNSKVKLALCVDFVERELIPILGPSVVRDLRQSNPQVKLSLAEVACKNTQEGIRLTSISSFRKYTYVSFAFFKDLLVEYNKL